MAIDGNGATISGNSTTRIFEDSRQYADSTGSDFTLVNATLTNGRDSGSGGAAVKGAQFGKMTFVNVNFSNNVSNGTGGEDGGGAIYKDEGGKLTVFNSHFSGNTATNGGAIKSLLSNLQIVNTSFVNNVARGGNNGGGAIFIDGLAQNSTPKPLASGGYAPNGYLFDTYGKGRLCGVLLKNNTVGNLHDPNGTGRQGGGLFTHTYTKTGTIPGTSFDIKTGYSRIEVERTIVEANTASDGGGGMRFGGDGGGTANVLDTIIRNNKGGEHGGGVRFSKTDGNFTNTTIADNCANVNGNVANCTSTSTGGGIGGGIVAFENQYNLNRVTMLRNRSASYGGAASQTTNVSVTGSIVNSLVANNTAGNPYGTAQNCSGPKFTNGAGSYQWPGVPGTDPNDLGCGTATRNVNPNLGATPAACPLRIAGSSIVSSPMVVFVPATSVPTSVGGSTNAGSSCPS